MSGEHEPGLPDVGETLLPLLARVPRERQPLLIALAERLAAVRYRGWAAGAADARRKGELLACAAREEDIATRVEALYPNAAAWQQDLVAQNPDLEAINHSLFADRPLAHQFTIQARGERLGAATWRSLAAHSADTAARETFLKCAELEEQSAAVLESYLTAGDD
jgi:hypothetical protein